MLEHIYTLTRLYIYPIMPVYGLGEKFFLLITIYDIAWGLGTLFLGPRHEITYSHYYVSGINTPWHAPVSFHFTGVFGDHQDLGLLLG